MKSKIPVIILMCLLALLVYIFFSVMEPYEETVDLGWDKKALRNPYLALEQFSEKMGIKTTSSNNFEELKQLPSQGLVFISNTSKVLTKQRVASLIEWMEAGGHVVVAASLFEDDELDPLLSVFSVEKYSLEDDESAAEDEEQEVKIEQKKLSDRLEELNEEMKLESAGSSDTQGEEKEAIIPDEEIALLSFTGIDEKLKLHFSTDTGLTHPHFYTEEDEEYDGYVPDYWANSEYATHFMQFSVGGGLLSVISDNTIWRSNRIDTLDHAYLFWLLSEDSEEVVILYGVNMPSIFYLIWKHASEIVIAFSVWLLAWIIYRSRRFGIIRESENAVRRSMSEHINASADYLWRSKKAEQLLELARIDVTRRLSHHYPAFTKMSRNKQTKFISNHTSLAVEKIDQAINGKFIDDENEFKKIISCIQTINNSL